MKDILFIGGPKTVKGVDRIDDDLMSILTAGGLYDRKVVVVWPSSGFLNIPMNTDELKPFVDMDEAALSVIRQRKMVESNVLNRDVPSDLKAQVKSDPEAIRDGIIGQAFTEALLRLAKLILAVSGGQNLVAVVDKDAPVYAMCWTKFVHSWSVSELKPITSYGSHEDGYGVLNSVKRWPWVFKAGGAILGKAGDLIPKYPFVLYGYDVTIGMDSLFDVLKSHDAKVELSYPVTDRLSGTRAVKVSTVGGYMLVIPEPDTIRNFVIGLKTAPKPKLKGEESSAIPKVSRVSTDQYMTRKDVADLLNATTRTVDRYIENGKLKSTKVEGKVLILKSSVDKLVEG